MSDCTCGGPLVGVRIGLTEKGILKGTVCWKMWCPRCENSKMNYKGEVIYYQILGGGRFTFDPLEFWAPESVKFQYKPKFIETVLKLANKNKFKGTQFYEMSEIRQAYKQEFQEVGK